MESQRGVLGADGSGAQNETGKSCRLVLPRRAEVLFSVSSDSTRTLRAMLCASVAVEPREPLAAAR